MEQGAGTSPLLGMSFSRKTELLRGPLNCVSSKQKQNEKKKKSQNIMQEVVF